MFRYLNRWNEPVSECCEARVIETSTRFPRKICTNCRKFAKVKNESSL